MILWTIKLIGFVRRAIAGRRYPHQLAWAVAFGLLLGIVPHGNLLALVLLVLVLSLKLNHAMAALTAVAASFLATRLDPVSHEVGEFLLTHPDSADLASTVWSLPMVPWTDLNNTVVLGSFTIGVVGLLPAFLITYPVFRLFVPADDSEREDSDVAVVQAGSAEKTVSVDPPHTRVPAPLQPEFRQPAAPSGSVQADDSVQPSAAAQAIAEVHPSRDERIEFIEVHQAHQQVRKSSIETRIDVIRVNEPAAAQVPASQGTGGQGTGDQEPADATTVSAITPTENQQMDEALNYLLRQLRDSQQRNVA